MNPDRTGLRAVAERDIAEAGTVVHREKYGLVAFDRARGEAFRTAATDGTTERWATDVPDVDDLTRLRLAEASWRIEEYRRGLKRATNVERCQCRVGRAQRNHIGLAPRAFVVLERWCFRTGASTG